MASFIYNSFKEFMGDGTIDMDDDTFKIVLLDDTYIPSVDHSLYSDVSPYELPSGSGYTAGGQALQGVTWVRSGGTVTMDASDPTWAAATFNANYAAIYDSTTVDNKLVCLLDFGGKKYVSSGVFTVNFSDSGIIAVN